MNVDGGDLDVILSNADSVVGGELRDLLDHAHNGVGVHLKIEFVGNHASLLLDEGQVLDRQNADVVYGAPMAIVLFILPNGGSMKKACFKLETASDGTEVN